MPDESHPTEPADRPRRRFRWWHGVLIILAIPLLTWAAWRIAIEHAVDSRLDDIRALGLPADAAELDAFYPAVPTDENAAPHSADAFTYMVRELPNAALNANLPLVGPATEMPGPDEPLDPYALRSIDEFVDINAPALERLHDAARYPKSRYPVDLNQGMSTIFVHLSPMRDAARLLRLESAHHISRDDPDKALRSVHTALALARSIENEPILVSALVRISILANAVDTAERLLNHARLDDAQLRSLAAELGRAHDTDQMRRAIAGERAMVNDLFRHGFSGTGVNRLDDLYPAFRAAGIAHLDQLVYLDLADRSLQALDAPTHERLALAAAIDRDIVNTPFYAVFTSAVTPSLNRAFTVDLYKTAALRATITAIAVERYRLAHGRLPGSLDDLPPELLESRFAIDPFTGDPLHYVTGPDGFTVYSLGEDLRDNGGTRLDASGRSLRPGTDVVFTIRRP